MEHIKTIKTSWKRATVTQYDNVVVIRFDYNNEPDIRIRIDTETDKVQFFNHKNTATNSKVLLDLLEE